MNHEIPLIFKDFSSVIDFQKKIFGNKKFVRSMFPLKVPQHRKRLQRFHLVITYFDEHVDKVGRTKALADCSKVFNSQNVHLIK